ncbi:hypothetical protein [Nitrosomonas oligotropha]|uniref:hypothetical protein n=1 Tax=Nitrosomonas oligotropha TaxID=42354 RepID=UPI00136CCC99|nr:hypothetical protein [Nitrosomonas oligotropha]MXS82781.1 hypothetical protein [Nitrosomonas oligotropha]
MLTADKMTEELQDVFTKLKTGKIKAKEATEMINATGKMISIQKTQLGYQIARGEKPEMQFFSASSANNEPKK